VRDSAVLNDVGLLAKDVFSSGIGQHDRSQLTWFSAVCRTDCVLDSLWTPIRTEMPRGAIFEKKSYN